MVGTKNVLGNLHNYLFTRFVLTIFRHVSLCTFFVQCLMGNAATHIPLSRIHCEGPERRDCNHGVFWGGHMRRDCNHGVLGAGISAVIAITAFLELPETP